MANFQDDQQPGSIFDTNGLLVGTIPGQPGMSLAMSGQAAANYVTSNGGTLASGYPPPGSAPQGGGFGSGPPPIGDSVSANVPPGSGGGPTLGPSVDQQIQLAVAQYKQSLLIPNNGKTFTTFQPGDIIENQQDTVTKGLWSGNIGNLLTFYTSSAETATQKIYYYEIFQSSSTTVGSEPQFAVTYGNRLGSGSATIGGGTNNDTPTRSIYGQYKLLLLDRDDDKFTINGVDTDNIYVINFNRARMREQMDPGNMEINLARLSGSAYVLNHPANNYTSSGFIGVDGTGAFIRLIDDSSLVTDPTVGSSGKVYNIVSGSIDNGVFSSTAPHYYGLFYPQMGIAVLNGDTLDLSSSFATATASNTYGNNAYQLYTAISGAALFTQGGDSLGFAARSSENIKSQHYFVRAKNAEYNLSNNPSYVTGSDGDFKQPGFLDDPKSYMTTVGLYNNRRELLAVAKLSKPLLKDFTREALIKVKLEY